MRLGFTPREGHLKGVVTQREDDDVDGDDGLRVFGHAGTKLTPEFGAR